jgi:two-component system response regulator NreC
MHKLRPSSVLARELQATHSDRVRIVIVEDHLMFREVLRKVCTVELKHEVVGEAADGHAAVEIAKKLKPDLVLLDLHLPGLDGFAVAEVLRKTLPATRILVLSSHCDEYTVFRAEKAHVQGFVDKNSNSVEALKAAITTVAAGRVSYSPAYQKIKAARHQDPQSFDKILTERERSVLSLIGEPLADDEIGERLEIATETVEKHRFNLLKKLGLRTTTELVRYARDHGFTLSARRSGDDVMLP